MQSSNLVQPNATFCQRSFEQNKVPTVAIPECMVAMKPLMDLIFNLILLLTNHG